MRQVVPRVLAENSGVKSKEVISKLYAAHAEGKVNVGFDIDGESGEVKVGNLGILLAFTISRSYDFVALIFCQLTKIWEVWFFAAIMLTLNFFLSLGWNRKFLPYFRRACIL